MKKKVLFLIYSSEINSGGGHFYSLLTIVQELSEHIDFKLLNVGLTYPKILQNNKIPSQFIPISKGTYFSQIKLIRKEIESYNPDVIHAFDLNALRVARSVNFKDTPIIFNKCGGINGAKIVCKADAYICFSEENVDHFTKYKKNNSPLYLIPNRVKEIVPDTERIEKLKEEYGLEGKKVFLRISRFSFMHELSIKQSVNLFKAYYAKDKNSCLLIIGMIQSQEVHDNISQLAAGFPIYIINDEYYCKEASGLLDVADVIVATGRGVMEAASLNKPIFCPLYGHDLPVPLIAKNYEILSKFNFSGRTTGIDYNEAEISDFLLNRLDELSVFSAHIFKDKFDVKAAIGKYLDIYNNTKHNKTSFASSINYMLDMLYFFKPNL